ncbi:type I DNA topoisomerase [Radicibacter daui]|uniref:type I DNA topoisomerase n=1 Tax=Radicibacter daui TaxID=3064829 RepID=UPI004046B059
MSGKNVVIVESPAKAKTINKYLGSDYTVLASFGHVRDLPAKDGSVLPDEDFAMSWELSDRAERQIKEITKAAKAADTIFLATDPDREGEAISWHVQQVLGERLKLDGKTVRRVTFNEITKNTILDAIRNPRDLDQPLIDAYMARRALDYLVGFTLSPVLWRKLPGSRSAGRVQSVALRLICEREAEIEIFVPREYWSVEATFTTTEGGTFTARLTHLNGKKLDKFALANEADAKAAVEVLAKAAFRVGAVERKQARRNPSPPFITSTLQQEASRKLGFGATRTMRLAQKLYEGIELGGETVGLITYMRTDGTSLSQEAIGSIRALIDRDFGGSYVPAQPRIYKSTAKNAQEAHEAIRPTDIMRRPGDVAQYLDRDELRLYDLIWKRTVACEMESAVLDQVAVDVDATDHSATLRATGSIIRFDGFLRLYQEGKDDTGGDDEQDRRLPAMKETDPLTRGEVRPEQHFTQPPPRFTEASLVKRLEELGIGRPSTYASILQVLQDRDYVKLENRRFVPEDRGRLVTAFLSNFFERYVEYDFTADLEEKLDEISTGSIAWRDVLRQFWFDFHKAVDGTKELTVSSVLDTLDRELGPHFFGEPTEDRPNPRACPTCGEGRLSIKLGKFGAFIGCSNYPTCNYTRPLTAGEGSENEGDDGPRHLGNDPVTGLPVTLRRGPYGQYVQLGPKEGAVAVEAEAPAKGKGKKAAVEKPKRVSLPRGEDVALLTLDRALGLLSLPRDIGHHPETKEMIQAGIGRFGPYLKHGGVYKSLTADDDVLEVGMNRAVALLGDKLTKAGPLRELGEHPRDKGPVSIHSGRFGPYVKHAKTMASLRKGMEVESLTMEQAIELLDAKSGGAKGKTAKKAPAADGDAAEKPKAAKAAARKAPAKKTAAKAPAKKAASATKTKKTAAAD